MPELEQPSSTQKKIEGLNNVVEEKDDVSKLFDDEAQEESQTEKLESEELRGGETLDQDEVDRLLWALEPGQDERLAQVTPERIAQEWGELRDVDRKFILTADDEKFQRTMDTLKEKFRDAAERKIQIMTVLRRLVKSNHPLAANIER